MRRLLVLAAFSVMLAGCMARPQTALERAAAAGDTAEVERLLGAGAGRDLLGGLVWAARSGRAAVIPVLVKHGANANGTAGVNGWTVLMHAIHKDKVASVRALLDAGADPNGRTARGGTPLSMAAGYGEAEIVRLLLARGAKPDAQSLELAISGVGDIDNWTTGKCQADTVRCLIERHPDLVTPELLSRLSSKLDKCPDVGAALSRRVQRARRD